MILDTSEPKFPLPGRRDCSQRWRNRGSRDFKALVGHLMALNDLEIERSLPFKKLKRSTHGPD